MKKLAFLILFFFLTIPLFATIYYVDTTTGADGDSGLTTDLAWQTIGKVNTEFGNALFNPGDSILFKRGEIWVDAVLTITTGGSAGGGYLTIGAYGTGDKPLFDCDSTRTNAVTCSAASVDYVRVQDIKSKDSTANAFVFSSQARTNIILSRLEVEGTDANNGIYLDQVDTYIIEDCYINAPSNSGIVIYGSASNGITNGIIRYNIINGDGCGNDGITIHRDGALNDAGANHYLVGNIVYDATEEGYDITSGSDILLRNNESYGNDAGSILVGNVNTDRIFIEGHLAHDVDGEGIILGTVGTHMVVSNSIVYNVKDKCVHTTGTEYYVANCTLIGTPNGGNVKFDLGDNSSTVKVRNCVCDSTNSGASTYVRYTGSATPANTGSDFDYNIWYNPDADNTVTRWNAHNWADWQGTDSQDANGSFADPSLQDVTKYEFQYNTGSNCINAGTWLTTISTATGSGTSFTVGDASWFHDGFDLVTGSEIQLEGSTVVLTVTEVNYTTEVITVDQTISWTQGDGVAFKYYSTSPDCGT